MSLTDAFNVTKHVYHIQKHKVTTKAIECFHMTLAEGGELT